MDYLLTVRLAGAAGSLLTELERVHGYQGPRLLATGPGHASQARLAILGSDTGIWKARKDLERRADIDLPNLPVERERVDASLQLLFTTFVSNDYELVGRFRFMNDFLDTLRTDADMRHLLCSWNVGVHVYTWCFVHGKHSITRHAVKSSQDVDSILKTWLTSAANDVLHEATFRAACWRKHDDRLQCCNCTGGPNAHVERRADANRHVTNNEILLAFVDDACSRCNFGIAGAPLAVFRFREALHHYLCEARFAKQLHEAKQMPNFTLGNKSIYESGNKRASWHSGCAQYRSSYKHSKEP